MNINTFEEMFTVVRPFLDGSAYEAESLVSAERILISNFEQDHKRLDTFISKYYEKRERVCLNQVVVGLVREMFFVDFNIEVHIRLVLRSMEDKLISSFEAAELLSGIPLRARKLLSPNDIELIEVADQVYEDEIEKFHLVDDDNCFIDVVSKYASTKSSWLLNNDKPINLVSK